MSQTDTKIDKARLKALRQERRESVERAKGRVKESVRIIRAIETGLGAGPQNIPDLARATGLSPAEALWWVTGLRKFGRVVEVEKNKATGYWTYAAAAADKAAVGDEAS